MISKENADFRSPLQTRTCENVIQSDKMTTRTEKKARKANLSVYVERKNDVKWETENERITE